MGGMKDIAIQIMQEEEAKARVRKDYEVISARVEGVRFADEQARRFCEYMNEIAKTVAPTERWYVEDGKIERSTGGV